MPATNPLALLAMAVEKGADPDQLGKLLDLQERFERNEAAKAFGVALAKFQAACPPIVKNRSIDLGGGKGPLYANLDDIIRVVAPVLRDCGLAVTFSASITDAGMLRAVCKVHCGAHVEVSEITLPVPAQMRVNDTQKMGAALSYAKRYALCAALNIVVTDEDNDAAALDMEFVTDAQAQEIVDLLKKKGKQLDGFCAWAQVASVNELSVAKYREAKAMLRK
jgi:hypothetical protein